MVLRKLKDFNPNYREEIFGGHDINKFEVYTERNQRIGAISDALVDEEGHVRYFVIDTGFWIFGKRVLLPVGRSRMDHQAQRIYVVGLDQQQAEHLPEYHDNMSVDPDYEERVRRVYRPSVGEPPMRSVEDSAPLEASALLEPLEASRQVTTAESISTQAGSPISTRDDVAHSAPSENAAAVDPYYVAPNPTPGVISNQQADNATPYQDQDTYNYQQEPSLYGVNEQDHQILKLYEERLIANKIRQKTGEVTIGKHVETEIARASVPVNKERVVVERTGSQDIGSVITPGALDFQDGEVTRIEIYEEVVDIRKQPVLREEVRVRKQIDQDTVHAEETVRREELDINTEVHPPLDRRLDQPPRDRF